MKSSVELVDILRSHDELRAALIVAGRELRKLRQRGRKDMPDPLLIRLRQVLAEARQVRRAIDVP